ncbi:UNVERIFIED_CONTAM: hypothetical protein K2H54_043611 [Gekko kuhli]
MLNHVFFISPDCISTYSTRRSNSGRLFAALNFIKLPQNVSRGMNQFAITAELCTNKGSNWLFCKKKNEPTTPCPSAPKATNSLTQATVCWNHENLCIFKSMVFSRLLKRDERLTQMGITLLPL